MDIQSNLSYSAAEEKVELSFLEVIKFSDWGPGPGFEKPGFGF